MAIEVQFLTYLFTFSGCHVIQSGTQISLKITANKDLSALMLDPLKYVCQLETELSRILVKF